MTSDSLSVTVGRAFYGGFAKLRAMQLGAVAPVLAGGDVLITSGTGSGKTEAIAAPLIDRLLREAAFSDANVQILYVTPTRALGNDLLKRLAPPLDHLGLLAGIRHGEQNDVKRARKPDLLITTPESIDVMITSGEVGLRGVRAVVIDEAHLFYNSQRGFQLGVLLRRLENSLGRPLQVAGLSATVADPREIWAFLRPGREVTVVDEPTTRDIDYVQRSVTDPSELLRPFEVIGTRKDAKALVFTNSRRAADEMALALRGRTPFGERVFVHHSSLSATQRLATERDFGSPGKAVCVATSTLELGIDIGDIDIVVLYGHPGGWESFLQRIGRGNRRSSRAKVLMLAAPDLGPVRFQQIAYEALVWQVRRGGFEREPAATLYGAGLQQILSMVIERNGAFVRLPDLLAPLAEWPGYSDTEVDAIVDRLTAEELVTRHGFKNQIGAASRLYRMLDMRWVWGNFPMRSRDVAIRERGKDIGQVPFGNALSLQPRSVFTFAGRNWAVESVDHDGIQVQATKSPATMKLVYGGSRLPIDPSCLESMLEYIAEKVAPEGLSGDAAEDLQSYTEAIAPMVEIGSLPNYRTPSGEYGYLTFAGRSTNAVLAQAAGVAAVTVGDTFVETASPLRLDGLSPDPDDLACFVDPMVGGPLELTVFQSLLPLDLLRSECVQAWRRSPVTRRTLKRLTEAKRVPVLHDDVVGLLA